MSFERVPPRSEVMGWSPYQLADFLKKMNLSGSDKVVLQASINGARFVDLTENDVLKFPKLHAPMISKICSEMNKKDERRGLFNKKTTTTKYREPEPSGPIEDVGWGADEFSDDDYEDPDVNLEDEDSQGDYESPTEEVEENDYEPNPSESTEDFPQVVRPSLPIGEGDYIDNINNHTASRGPPTVSPRPIASTHLAPAQVPSHGRDPSPFRDKLPGSLGPAAPQPPKIQRHMKPTQDRGDNPSPQSELPGRAKFNTLERPSTPSGTQSRPQEWSPKPPSWSKPMVPPGSSASVGRNSVKPPAARFHPDGRSETQHQAPASKHHTFPLQSKALPPRPGLPVVPTQLSESLPANIPRGTFTQHSTQSASVSRSSSNVERRGPPRPGPPGVSPHSNMQQRTQELDPCWYVGKISRDQADHCLKKENKDGSYLVRDSTQQKANQPYTLMVLYQAKVYNIQIRLQNHQYLLGTGMNVHETFPTVRAMINHYSQTPLLLIDAKNRCSTVKHNQCLLSYPAGYQLT